MTNLGDLKIGPFRGNSGAIYEIIEQIGKGGNGQAWRARVAGPAELMSPTEVVVKIPLLHEQVEFGALQDRLQALNESLLREIHLKYRLRNVRCVAQIVDNGQVEIRSHTDVPLFALFVVQQFVAGQRLDEYVCERFPDGDGSFCGIPDAETLFDVSLKVARSLREIHKAQVVHGDVWFKNVILASEGAVFIDFGKSFLRDLNLARHTQDRKPRPFQPPEGRGSVKGDIHDFGGLLYYLATGQSVPPGLNKDNDALKSSIRQGIEQANPVLYEQNSAIVDIIARCRRFRQYERFHSVEGVIQDLEMFGAHHWTDSALEQPPHLISLLESSEQPLFARLARLRVRAERRIMEDMIRGVYDLTGDHEDIVSGFTLYLSALREADQYLTLTVPTFWLRHNLGVNGRVLEMNKIAALRGATIRRVFLLTEMDRQRAEVVQIIGAHVRIERELASMKTGPVATGVRDLGAGGYYCGFLMVTEEQRSHLVAQRSHFGLLVSGQRPTLAAPVYTEDGHVVGLEFRTEPDFTRGKMEYFVDRWLTPSRPLAEFLPEGLPAAPPSGDYDPSWPN